MRQFSFSKSERSRGFTLIELLFAMSFVSVLLILILTATLQITRIYNKGITLKQVNQSGASVGAELQTSLKAVNAPITNTFMTNGDNSGGRLCLGAYSYVWNLKGATTNQYIGGGGGNIGMVKVADSSGSLCQGTPNVDKSKATELILGDQSKGGVQLQLRDFSITRKALIGINYIYEVSYTISTSDNSLINASGCKGGASDEFCALNQFTFDVFSRVGGNGVVQ